MQLRNMLVKIGKIVPDKMWVELIYRYKFGKKLNLKNPVTFNEKLQWLKIYDHNEQHAILVDKEKVKAYVADLIGEEYIIPTIGVWTDFDDIDFGSLPNRFVLKCTHDSGGLCVCKDKKLFDRSFAKKKINKSLKRDYYLDYREWPYKKVKHKIIAEQYLEDNVDHELRDYKFFCFGGRVEFFKVDFDRFKRHRANYYDRQQNLLPFGEADYPPDFERKIEIPDKIEDMIRLAEKIASNEPFVRIDLYYCNKRIYFGEITFFPASGFGKFTPDDWDEKLGNYLKLPIFNN